MSPEGPLLNRAPNKIEMLVNKSNQSPGAGNLTALFQRRIIGKPGIWGQLPCLETRSSRVTSKEPKESKLLETYKWYLRKK